MTSVQERHQIKSVLLDKWTLREQLCLATAVHNTGENWVSVKRSLMIMCGESRPNDWFTQKSCAAQYAVLLRNMDSPKRKKRTTIDAGSTAPNESSGQSLVRLLTHERLIELDRDLQNDQLEYQRHKADIARMEKCDNLNELQDMYMETLKEKKLRDDEELAYEQSLRDREKRKQEHEQQMRHQMMLNQQAQAQSTSFTSLPTTPPKFDTVEVSGGCVGSVVEEDAPIAVTAPVSQGTSPLLTSLLKSPVAVSNPTTIASIQQQIATGGGGTNSPTLSTLLTQNVAQALDAHLNAAETMQSNHPLLSQPMCAVAPADHVKPTPPPPSQTAPTLSMLLENRGALKSQQQEPPTMDDIEKFATNSAVVNSIIGVATHSHLNVMDTDMDAMPTKDEEQQLMEVLGSFIPENIDELAGILTENNEIMLAPELLEEEGMLENVAALINEHGDALKAAQQEKAMKEAANQLENISNCVVQKIGQSGDIVSATVSDVILGNIDTMLEMASQNNQNVKQHAFEVPIQNFAQEIIEIVEDASQGNNEHEDEVQKVDQNVDNQPNEKQTIVENVVTPLPVVVASGIKASLVEKIRRSIGNEESSDSNDDKSLECLKREMKTQKELTVIEIEATDPLPDDQVIPVKATEETPDASSEKIIKKEGEKQSVLEEEKPKATVSADTSKKVDDNIIKIKNLLQQENIPTTLKENASILDRPIKLEPQDVYEISEEQKDVDDGDTIYKTVEEEIITKNKPINKKPEVLQKESVPFEAVPSKSPEIFSKPLTKEEPLSDSVVIKEEIKSPPTKDITITINKGDPKEVATVKAAQQQSRSRSTAANAEKQSRKLSVDEYDVLQCAKILKLDETPSPEIVPNVVAVLDIDTEDIATSAVEPVKEEKVTNKSKRELSRKKIETPDRKSADSCQSTEDLKHATSALLTTTRSRLKDRERSESPYIDEDMGTTPRTRRRYSSTPVIDSIPNSPASVTSDDRDYKAWKKTILMAYSRIGTNKYASPFQRPISEDHVPGYKKIVKRPMDLQTIKRNIENGTIRTTSDFQRDVMLMCSNAMMFNKRDSHFYSMGKELLTESVSIIDTVMDSWKKENEKVSNPAVMITKVRGRKSQRHMPS